MNFLRFLICFFTLLVQAWPVQAVTCAAAPEVCGMGCCAAMSSCGCAPSSLPSEPADLPPVELRIGAMQWTWVDPTESLLPPRSPKSLEETMGCRVPDAVAVRSHVPLAVLFCSFRN